MVHAVLRARARALPERIPLLELLGLFAPAGGAEAEVWRDFFRRAIEGGRLVAEPEARVIPARRVRVGRRVRSYGPLSDRPPDPSHRDIPERTETIAVYSRAAVRACLQAEGIGPSDCPLAWVWLEPAAPAQPDRLPPTAPRTRRDRLSEAIEEALDERRRWLGREPTDPELYERLRPGCDASGAVVDEDDSGLIWTDSQGKSHTTSHALLAKRFKRARDR
ncbi:hypothetical protein EV699_103137 [Plasticicumulans lactativorans]|uniref:Uncharacterized protein n=1 Tax=Plasticicumulans lactativorans TaxID=1133106 RepID=A0A4R2L6Q3_9GAMM|nr:hypothetical protein [Plasticicumulans lactativorans]TCO83088.1 hypothetical protein EV699_103137 [Plasticicumulans lactativorans]